MADGCLLFTSAFHLLRFEDSRNRISKVRAISAVQICVEGRFLTSFEERECERRKGIRAWPITLCSFRQAGRQLLRV